MLAQILTDLRNRQHRLHESVFRGYSLVKITWDLDRKRYPQVVADLKRDERELVRVNAAIAALELYGIQ